MMKIKRTARKKGKARVAPATKSVFCIAAAVLLVFSLTAPVSAGDATYEGGSSGKTMTQGNSLVVADPISAANGAYSFSVPLLSLGGPMDLDFTFHYSRNIYNCWAQESFPKRSGPIGQDGNLFWWSPRVGGVFWGHWNVRLENGDGVSFISDDEGGWVLNEGWHLDNGQPIRYVMKENETANHFYMMDPVRERVYILNDAWGDNKVLYAMDRSNNTLTYTYNGPDGRVSKINDGLGRELNFTYTTVGSDTVIDRVSDQTGRGIVFGYDASAADNGDEETLRNITDAMGHTRTFHYQAVRDYLDNIARVDYAEGNYHYESHFIEHSVNVSGEWYYGIRVDNQTDAYGNSTLLSYNKSAYRTTVANPDGSGEVYDHNSSHSPPKSLTDATGRAMNFTKNERNQITSVTDRFGDTTNFSYHQQTGRVASITNNKRDTMNYTYAEQNQTFVNPGNSEEFNFTFYNLARVDYPDGTNESFTYDANGNLLTHLDRVGRMWQYEYNDCGQVTKVTNPAGGVTDITYNADATIASSTDSDTGVTAYGYDTYKRLNRLTHPDSTFVRFDYDLNNRVTGTTDERGMTYNYTYDANGNLVNATDPAGNRTQYAHNLMDRIAQGTNRRGKTAQYGYDSMNRLTSVTDPNGNTYRIGYDARGWLNRSTDPEGNVWSTGYDDEGLVNATTTPLSHTTTITRDRLGRITAVTNPLGHSINFTRDSMSRITEASDALGRETNYTFDERGFLTSVTRPDIGTATYTHDDMGMLAGIRDQNGNDWAMAYTSIGRTQSLTDPLGNEWQYAYNERGLLNKTTYSTGETQNRSYDDAGNLVRRQYSDGTDLQFTYDDLNRLTAASGVGFDYNEVGRVVATTNPPASFGATYDDCGRRETATYADGLFTVTYQYNSRDLLTSVTDNLTGTSIGFAYDNDGRLTGITRSNGVNTTFTWDAATRLTRIRHDTGIDTVADLQYEYNAAGEITKMDYTLPLDPADHLTSETAAFTYDGASQVSSAGYSYDARGRQTVAPTGTFTWDGAGRLTGTGDATLAYNGLGDLVNRTAGGNTTHYYYNYALDLNPIVAEKDEGTGNWTRFCVLTPTGRLLYQIDHADSDKVSFHHFDRKGNTLFLTDAAGTVTDSYAYTPYGKLLHHEGASDQPFTFGGAYQARQEGDGDLYQMRARYYDANGGRFISREPLWQPRIGGGKAINPYQYALRNPMMFVDMTGMCDGIVQNDMWEFTEGDDYWVEVAADDPKGRGFDGSGDIPINDLHIYSEGNDGWKEVAADDPKGGGFDGSGDAPQNNNHAYTDDNDGWKDVDDPKDVEGGTLESPENGMWEYCEGNDAWKEVAADDPKKKVGGTTEFANLPGLGWQRGGGGVVTPYGYQLRADRLTGDRGAPGKLAAKVEANSKKDIKLSFDWKGSGGSLKVQPFQLAEMHR